MLVMVRSRTSELETGTLLRRKEKADVLWRTGGENAQDFLICSKGHE